MLVLVLLRLIPESVARVQVADVVLTRSRIGQIVAQFRPEVALTPANGDGWTEEKAQIGITSIVGPIGQGNGQQALTARLPEETGESSAHLWSRPLGFDKRLGDNEDNSAAGGQTESQRIPGWSSGRRRVLVLMMRCAAAAAVAAAVSREIAVLEAQSVGSFGRVLELDGHHLGNERLVLEAVADESIECAAVVAAVGSRFPTRGVRRVRAVAAVGARIEMTFRVAEADAVAGEDPDTNRLAVDEEDNCSDDNEQSKTDTDGHCGQVVDDGQFSFEACHERTERIPWTAAVELVEANDLLVAEKTVNRVSINELLLTGTAYRGDGGGRGSPVLEFGQETALTWPRIGTEPQTVEMRVDAEAPQGQSEQTITIET